jgi:hypothetical protein
MAIAVVQKRQDDDPLNKLANAVNIARSVYGVVADTKQFDMLKAKSEEARAQQELENKQRDRGLDIQERSVLVRDKDNKVENDYKKAQTSKLYAEINKMKNDTGKPDKRKQEFTGRYKNIADAIATLDKKIEAEGTANVWGSHDKDLQALVDSVAIDSAKLFDPESVARESEVAAFRNMLFEPGKAFQSDGTARDVLKNYQKILDSRAANEGLGDLVIEAQNKRKEQSLANNEEANKIVSPFTVGGKKVADPKQAARDILAKRNATAKN